MRNDHYALGAGRVLDYLADEFDEDGVSRSDPDNVQFYYKMPAVFAYGDRRKLALKTLEQFEHRFVKDGGLALDNDPIARPWSAYLAGWAAWGAAMLGRFDTARRITAGVGDSQDDRWGGLWHDEGGTRVMDTERSSAAAMGLLWSGDVERTRRICAFLDRALAARPRDDLFYAYFDAEMRPHANEKDRNTYFDRKDAHARPALFATPIASLVWFGRMTGDTGAFDTAAKYMDFILAHEDAARLPLATKTGWGALMLSQHVADGRLGDFARRSGDNLMDRLREDGSIDFDAVVDVPKPVAKVWLMGWCSDVALTLMALGHGSA